ncbi:TPA: 4-hydroxy-tetrahydrodipicolinate reductase [bacterium]|nr:4-hydroxy-tetrahydrodipicolinate reductase [bacterium]
MKIVVTGIGGRMGSSIARITDSDPEVKIVGLVEKKGHPLVGAHLYGIEIVDDLSSVINTCDCLIDFTTPVATIENVDIAFSVKKAIVIGTTGFSPDQMAHIKEASKHIPILCSSNMSFGMNVLFKILPLLSKELFDFDVELIEAHHRNKIDAPSGTAKRLLEALGVEGPHKIVYGRKGNDKRKKGEIGVFSIRGGDIVGDHTLIFAGDGEKIEITHSVTSRDCFAYGTIKAAKFIVKKERGLYSMLDVI